MTKKQYIKLCRHYTERSYDPKLSARDQCALVHKATTALEKSRTAPHR